ncbi:hypothetical protein [Bradyrhizobium oligotrophicum]|uniref:hypothetical protein n=1 Tax=Bradyrhizobium oligotrophicum TaxID=44255 RepID=UPI003EBD992E
MNDDTNGQPTESADMRARRSFLSNDEESTPHTAFDPANETFSCRCGKPSCFSNRLQPFREHIARLYRAIAVCEAEGCLNEKGWSRVLYPLQMAASLEDIRADTSFVDDSASLFLCSTAAEYEAAKTEMACKYVGGLSVFTFLWMAYEATVELTLPNELKKLLKQKSLGERGRRLFEDHADSFPSPFGLKTLAGLTEQLCERGILFDDRLDRIRRKFDERGLAFSAEICREFRNFIAHGEDEAPEHEDWHHGRGQGEATARIRRFYSISRLLMVLIQALAVVGLSAHAQEIEWGYDDDFEPLIQEPRAVLVGLHLLDDEPS